MSVVECQYCRRIRKPGSSDWGIDPSVFASVIGTCPTCFAQLEAIQKREYWRHVRQTVRRQTHREPWAPGTAPDDPFEGMREPRAEKARG